MCVAEGKNEPIFSSTEIFWRSKPVGHSQMNYTDQCSGSQMFLAPAAHPTHMQSAFKVEFIEGNVSDTLMPNQAFLLKCTFISDLNQGPTLCIEVIEADVCIMFCWLACQGKSFWWKCCKEKTGVTTWRTTNCEWVFFTAFRVVLVWVVVCACVFCISLAFRCRYIYACWCNFKRALTEYSGYQTSLFSSLLILDFLGRWTLNIGQNFCLQPSITTKMEFGLVLRVKLATRWVLLENLKPEYALYFDF